MGDSVGERHCSEPKIKGQNLCCLVTSKTRKNSFVFLGKLLNQSTSAGTIPADLHWHLLTVLGSLDKAS